MTLRVPSPVAKTNWFCYSQYFLGSLNADCRPVLFLAPVLIVHSVSQFCRIPFDIGDRRPRPSRNAPNTAAKESENAPNKLTQVHGPNCGIPTCYHVRCVAQQRSNGDFLRPICVCHQSSR